MCQCTHTGKNNVLADAFLRLPRMMVPLPGKNEEVHIDKNDIFIHESDGIKSPRPLPTLCCNVDVEMVELFMNLSALQEMNCHVTVQNIETY